MTMIKQLQKQSNCFKHRELPTRCRVNEREKKGDKESLSDIVRTYFLFCLVPHDPWPNLQSTDIEFRA